MSPSGLGGSGGGCIIRERGDWREAARLPALSPGENSKFGGYRRGLLMSTAKIFCRFYVSFFDIFLLEGMVTGGDTEPQICSISSRRLVTLSTAAAGATHGGILSVIRTPTTLPWLDPPVLC